MVLITLSVRFRFLLICLHNRYKSKKVPLMLIPCNSKTLFLSSYVLCIVLLEFYNSIACSNLVPKKQISQCDGQITMAYTAAAACTPILLIEHVVRHCGITIDKPLKQRWQLLVAHYSSTELKFSKHYSSRSEIIHLG